MKKYLIIFVIFLLNYQEIIAQDTSAKGTLVKKIPLKDITTKEASTKVGQEVRMVGRVMSVVYWNANAENKNCWFLNIDQPYPNNPVVVKILQKNYKKFEEILKDIRQESMVKIRITGIITLWKPQDREICPTIELKKVSQIDILY